MKGYARQHDLVPTNWISIEFGGEVPTFINGQITDLDEDQIEITQYNTNKKLYIDFDYKGLPINLPIVSIKSFIPPKDDEMEEVTSLEEDISDE